MALKSHSSQGSSTGGRGPVGSGTSFLVVAQEYTKVWRVSENTKGNLTTLHPRLCPLLQSLLPLTDQTQE